MKTIVGSVCCAGILLLADVGGLPPAQVKVARSQSPVNHPNVLGGAKPSFTPPTIRIVAPPSPVEFGDLIVVRAIVDQASLPPNLTSLKYQWVVLENGVVKSVIVWPDGTEIIFPAGMNNKQVTVILLAECLYEKKEGAVIKEVSVDFPDPIITIITVGKGPIPTPNPPQPTPPKPVILPTGRFGLAQFTYDTLQADNLMTQGEKVLLSQCLSTSFNTIAAKIAALSTYRSIEDVIIPDLKKSNDEAIAKTTIDISHTLPFKQKLNAQLYQLYHDKKVTTATDFGDAFREIATGFGAIK